MKLHQYIAMAVQPHRHVNVAASLFMEFAPTRPPFFMMLSFPAPHAPFTPAPQFQGEYASSKVPRCATWKCDFTCSELFPQIHLTDEFLASKFSN